MSWNGTGSWQRLFSWVADKAAAINITASRMDAEFNDYASNGFGNTLTRDGQGVPTANLPMAGFRHLNVASSQARAEYLATAQFQDGGPIWGGTSSGAANTFVITLTPAVTALVAGLRVLFKSHQANAGASTLQVNATAATAITKNGATALAANDIPNAAIIEAVYDGTQWELLSALAGTYLPLAGGTVTGATTIQGLLTASAGATISGAALTLSGQRIDTAAVSLASAATTSIGAVAGNVITISGTTTITSFGASAQVGALRLLNFSGSLTLTQGGSLSLPSGQNIVTQTGDWALVEDAGGGVWTVTGYFPNSGYPVKGGVAQIVNTETGAVATGTTVMNGNADTIPANTTGDQYMSLSITPKNANSTLIIDIVWNGTNSSAGGTITAALFQDATVNALAAVNADERAAGALSNICFKHKMAAGTTAATTFKVRVGSAGAGTTTFNGAASARLLGGVYASSITITEILP